MVWVLGDPILAPVMLLTSPSCLWTSVSLPVRWGVGPNHLSNLKQKSIPELHVPEFLTWDGTQHWKLFLSAPGDFKWMPDCEASFSSGLLSVVVWSVCESASPGSMLFTCAGCRFPACVSVRVLDDAWQVPFAVFLKQTQVETQARWTSCEAEYYPIFRLSLIA